MSSQVCDDALRAGQVTLSSGPRRSEDCVGAFRAAALLREGLISVRLPSRCIILTILFQSLREVSFEMGARGQKSQRVAYDLRWDRSVGRVEAAALAATVWSASAMRVQMQSRSNQKEKRKAVMKT